jgi:lipopolysaccharide biosynthesis regulator YciM
MGLLYEAQGKTSEAVRSFQRSIERNIRAVQSHIRLSHIFLGKRDYCSAATHIRTVLKINIQHPEARRLYGTVRVGLQGVNCADKKINQ